MKKIFLFLSVVSLTMLFSCTDDDGGSTSNKIVKAKINNVEKTFSVISKVENTYTEDDYTWTDVKITAKQSDDATKFIEFIIEKGITGAEASWYFAYNEGEKTYEKTASFATEVTESNNSGVKGTFSGTLQDTSSDDVLTITDGMFDIKY